MKAEKYDNLVQCLMEELSRELPSVLTINKIIEQTACPYLRELARSKMNKNQPEK
ncbi:hypothetical protein LVD15_15440 [Fulvivirga maritima]|uniref:hypothetical protein n=1 Tax=Fulvivirga maritima TaxID=2904247 RepID=UPI001F337847|nr:hypothetical protein [Fulvivirga maritima]UII24707.1 hypothetical protein LVD15_15440 [Fulvivirga maritima]